MEKRFQPVDAQVLWVMDNDRGFLVQEHSSINRKRVDLIGMGARLEFLGAWQFRISSSLEEGTCLEVWIPWGQVK